MKLPASDLKNLVRRLSVVPGEVFSFDGGAAYSVGQNLSMICKFPNDFAGQFGVSADKLAQIAGRLDGELNISVNESKLVLAAKRTKLTLPIISDSRIAKSPVLDNWRAVPLDRLRGAVEYALQATEKAELFSYQGAVQISEKYVAGTDGKRLAVAEFGASLAESIILPVPAAQSLKAFEGTSVEVGSDQQNLYFRTDTMTLIARRLAKAFPDYVRLIPAKLKYKFQFGKDELRNTLRQISPLVEEKIQLTIDCNECKFSVTGIYGSGESSSDCQQILPDPLFEDAKFEASYNFEFIQDFVESAGSEVLFGANSSDGPALLESGSRKLIMAARR